MFRQFYPREHYASVYDIDFQDFFNKGFRAVLFDIDNTLVKHDAPADLRSKELITRLHSTGFKVCIISNNHPPRVESFAKDVGCSYIYEAAKPSPEGYLKGCALLGVPKEKTLFVGDQLFTDIWGANRAGIYSIHTKQIGPDPYFYMHLKRIGEHIVWPFYLLYRRRLLPVTAKNT